MVWYSYELKSSEEVFQAMSHFSSMWFTDLLLLLIILGGTIFCMFIIIPFFVIFRKDRQDERSKKVKKQLLGQILLQKEIEEEIERELDFDEKNKKK